MIDLDCRTFLENPESFFPIDIRSPVEFKEGYIVGARNLPIFTDIQRAEIGTLYKQVGRDTAVQRGVDFFGQRLSENLSHFKNFEKEKGDKKILLYCARGGMRSKVFCQFLNSLNFPVLRLEGGYKAYRAEILRILEKSPINPTPLVIDGFTGTGKTHLLRELISQFPVLDLEALAGHRSSLFGGVGLTCQTQKNFERDLAFQLNRLNNQPFFLIEAESGMVGPRQCPKKVIEAIQRGPRIFLSLPLTQRTENIVHEYFDTPEKVEEVKAILPKFKNLLGDQAMIKLEGALKEGDYYSFSQNLLEDYYDPRYRHCQKKRSFEITLEVNNLTEAKSGLIDWVKQKIEKGEIGNLKG